jgi:spore photoproduct lyase
MPSSDPSGYITSLSIERGCEELPYVKEIIRRSGLPFSIIEERQVPVIDGEFPGNLSRGKRHLLLCRNRGRFFKPCPGTREYRCCDYQVLNIGMNCPMECVYCILQAYLNNPWLSFFVNIEELFREVTETLGANPDRLFRIGTGEFTDSLALDRLTGLSRHLVNCISQTTNGALELKTKSAVIENLQGLEHRGKVVIGWSLNAPRIMATEEIRTATLEERLQAAARCASWGYRLAFHFDPIIDHEGWREGYKETISRLFSAVPVEQIAWISMGALRYLPALKSIATSRFPGSRIFYNEFIEGLDGKARYFRSQRVEMYKFIADEIGRSISPGTCLYFCMENDAVWQEVFGFTPDRQGGLPAMLDRTIF